MVKMTAMALLGGVGCASAFVGVPLGTSTARCQSNLHMSSADPSQLTRRQALQTAGATAVAAGVAFAGPLSQPALADGPYTLPDLPYGYDALEPHIDAATMKFHHDKHHAAYVANVNKALAGKDAPSILELQTTALKTGGAVRNSGGGHYNHALFWTTLGPASKSGQPSASLQMAIESSFGSLDALKEKFNAAAAGIFGSGWAWVGVTPGGKLEITTTPNQDNPLMEGANCTPLFPIMGLDVWEHAYYLKYQNRRPEYIAAFWNVVNWAKVSEYYDQYALKGKGVPVQG